MGTRRRTRERRRLHKNAGQFATALEAVADSAARTVSAFDQLAATARDTPNDRIGELLFNSAPINMADRQRAFDAIATRRWRERLAGWRVGKN